MRESRSVFQREVFRGILTSIPLYLAFWAIYDNRNVPNNGVGYAVAAMAVLLLIYTIGYLVFLFVRRNSDNRYIDIIAFSIYLCLFLVLYFVVEFCITIK